MASGMQHGYLALADISGFTSYLAGSELDHANEILSELLELIIGRLTPTLTLAEVEGDAVYVYGIESALSRGETLLELVESTYAAFQDRVEGVRRRTTCECNACRNIPSLDLKFLVHHGDYILQNVMGKAKPLGSTVNLVHRLVKNHVAEATGWRGYALFTADSLEHMCIQPEGQNWHAGSETYDLGPVQTYSLNLRERYKEQLAARRVIVTPEMADTAVAVEIPAPPAIVWNWLNDPARRLEWQGQHFVAAGRPGGRTTTQARNHCVHGKDVSMVETVLDWRPFDYFTVEQVSNGMPLVLFVTHSLEPLPRGTRLTVNSQVKTNLPGPLKDCAWWLIRKAFHLDDHYFVLRDLIAKEQSTAAGPEALAPVAAPTPA